MQLGSYYGASVLSEDFNNDGHSDLLVGAPTYKDKDGDEGKVYVYLYNQQVSFVRSTRNEMHN